MRNSSFSNSTPLSDKYPKLGDYHNYNTRTQDYLLKNLKLAKSRDATAPFYKILQWNTGSV